MSTDVRVVVSVSVGCACPKCGRSLEEKLCLDEESLRTGNTTQRAAYAVELAKARIVAAKGARGWLDDRCGRCRDTQDTDRKARGGELRVTEERGR